MIELNATSRGSRCLAILLLGALCLGSVCGCGSPEGSSSGGVPAAEEREAAKPSPTDDKPDRVGTKPAALLDIPPLHTPARDEAVRRQLQDARSALDRLHDEPEVSSSQLGQNYGEMGMLYHAYGLHDAAEVCYRNARTLQPQTFRWAYYLGKLHAKQGNTDSAVDAFGQALAIKADDVPALINLARTYLAANRPEEAKPFFERALAKKPSCAAAHAGLGEICLLRKEHEAAARYFENVLRIQPGATTVHYSLAMAYRGLKQKNKAVEHLARRGYVRVGVADPLMHAIETLPTGVQHHMMSGAAAAESGKVAEGFAKLRKAVEADPDNSTARLALATALVRYGDQDGAIEQFRQALRIRPELVQAHYDLGLLLGRKGSDDQAMEHFRQAVAADPRHVASHLGLAKLALKIGENQLADTHYALAIEFDPRNPAARIGQVIALAKQAKYAEAFDCLEKSREALPKSMILMHVSARLLATCPEARFRDGPKALLEAQTVFRVRQCVSHAETVAMAFAETGKYDMAIKWQSEAIRVAGNTNLEFALPRLKKNLELYKSGKPCRQAW